MGGRARGRAAWCRRIHDRVRYERTQCKEDRTEGDTGSPIPTPLGGVIAPLNEHPDIQSLSAPMGTGGRDETFTAAMTEPLNLFMRYALLEDLCGRSYAYNDTPWPEAGGPPGVVEN